MSLRTAPRIRRATPLDKPGYIRSTFAGYELDPQFRWRYPRRHEYPDDAQQATGKVLDLMMARDDAVVLVAELPRLSDSAEPQEGGDGHHDQEWTIVAGAIWEWRDFAEYETEAPPSGFSPSNSGRRDMDPVRQQAFIDLITSAEKVHFGPEWGAKRLELADMSCDPRYHRRGAGKALLEYGLQMAREANTPVTLTSSPMGRELYRKLGFAELGLVDIDGGKEEEGGEGIITTWVMVWVPDGFEKSPVGESGSRK